MAHELDLPAGWRVDDVVRELRAEFAYVAIDEEEGLRRARAKADWIEKASPSVFLGRHEAALAHARALRELKHGEVVVVAFGDGPQAVLTCLLCPGDAVSFGYASEQDELRASSILQRLARRLRCEVSRV